MAIATIALHLTIAALPASLAAQAPPAAQQPNAAPGYPDRDILSPFRNPQEISAPPDELFARLRTMRRLADDPAAVRSFAADGGEQIDDDTWRECRRDAERIGIDAGVLAVLMRNSRNADDRATAFYAAFHCANEDHVFNLISHIPGEPERATRERAMPRAIEFVRRHIGKKFGDLSAEEQQQLLRDMPQPGSPVAHARGINRLPIADDQLFTLNLKPFLQLLDLDDSLDQAQALWFLKEVGAARLDLAQTWLEPSLPRIRQLAAAVDLRVREQAIGLIGAIGPDDLALPAADADASALEAFVDRALRRLFPPIRRIGEGLVLLFPSADRDAIARVGSEALDGDRIGELTRTKFDDGTPYHGFRVMRVPEELAPLGLPKGAVIRSINGAPVADGRSLLATIRRLVAAAPAPANGPTTAQSTSRCNLVVEFVVGQETRAMEFRVM